MPTRKSVWLYDYDHVKYRTGLQWALSFVAGLALACLGCMGIWSVIIGFRSGLGIETGLLAISAMCLANRRVRGEMTGYFDYEIVDDGSHKDSQGVHHGPDHH